MRRADRLQARRQRCRSNGDNTQRSGCTIVGGLSLSRAMNVRFLTDQHQSTYKRVARHLIGLWGDRVEASLELPAFSVTAGSARVDIQVIAWRDNAIVRARSTVVSRAAVDFDLMEFLLFENAAMDVGAFALTRGGDVVFQHSILGLSCEAHEVRLTVQTVMHVADQYDDRIQARWGGQRAIDRRKTMSVVTTGRPADGSDSGETVQFKGDELKR